MLNGDYDCLAVPLPPSFQGDVEAAIDQLPRIFAVLQRDVELGTLPSEEPRDPEHSGYSYVPIDPCQPVIAAIRLAIGEHMPRHFVDLETPWFEANLGHFPDPYALKKVTPAGFAAAVLPSIGRPTSSQHTERIAWMARRLHELELDYKSILFVCSLLDWPWVREAYLKNIPVTHPEQFYAPIETHPVDPETMIFFLGELPFITGLYERGRSELTPDDNLSIDGVKEMVLAARDHLTVERPRKAQRITPQLLSLYFRYIRNLSLIERRLTPDLYTLITAAKQTAGDDFALSLTEVAREYPYSQTSESSENLFRMGIEQAIVPGDGLAPVVSRLPGQVFSWQHCELRPRPEEHKRKTWQQKWNPYERCSYPPEDTRIESFQLHVREQAKAILGEDLARSEKFTTSVMDGLDMRETLRHWHTGELYVKVIPPSRGSIEVVVMLFDVPADPKVYVERTTWYAEHDEESTLAFFATDPMQNLVGPGIAQAEYGGAFFLFPPRPIPDIWTDPRLNFTDTLEERLLSGALIHSEERHVAIVAPKAPPAAWRRLASRFGRKLVYLPLKRFSGQVLDRLRTFHVLNGKHVRSYAADFIRDM